MPSPAPRAWALSAFAGAAAEMARRLVNPTTRPGPPRCGEDPRLPSRTGASDGAALPTRPRNTGFEGASVSGLSASPPETARRGASAGSPPGRGAGGRVPAARRRVRFSLRRHARPLREHAARPRRPISLLSPDRAAGGLPDTAQRHLRAAAAELGGSATTPGLAVAERRLSAAPERVEATRPICR